MRNNIASERRRLRMKQEDLARAINVSVSSIARWEQGETAPTAETLKKMHEVFGCSIDYLLGITDERLWRSDL